MKVVKGFILTLCLIVASAASAAPPPAWVTERVDEFKASLQTPYVVVDSESLPASERSTLGKMLKDQKGNILTMWILAGSKAVTDQMELDRIQGHKFDAVEYLKLIAKVSAEITSGGQNLFATGGAVVTTWGANQMAGFFRDLKANPEKAATFEKVLANSIQKTLGTAEFLGVASAFGELWNSAFSDLPPRDREKATNLITAVIRAGRSGSVNTATAELADQGRIWSEVLANAGKIAIFNNDKRRLWLYDTWRNDIATGGFVTSTAGMIAGGQAGAALGSIAGDPGAVIGGGVGSLAGLLAASHFVPEKTNQAITNKLIEARKSMLQMKLDTCMRDIGHVSNYANEESHQYNRKSQMSYLMPKFEHCEAIRNDYMTIIMAQMQSTYAQTVVFEEREKMAANAGLGDIAGEFRKKLDRANVELKALVDEANKFYPAQAQAFRVLLKKFPNANAGKTLDSERRRMENVAASLKENLQGLMTQPKGDNAVDFMLINAIYGFQEERVLSDGSFQGALGQPASTEISNK